LRRRIVAVALVLAIGACRHGTDALPPAVQGTWTTSTPAYGDRYLRLADQTVEFGLGGHDADLYGIRRVEAEEMIDGSALYTIQYSTDREDTLSLRFFYRPGDPPTLKLDHQDAIWTRSETGTPTRSSTPGSSALHSGHFSFASCSPARYRPRSLHW
jgi:hypothetical protein